MQERRSDKSPNLTFLNIGSILPSQETQGLIARSQKSRVCHFVYTKRNNEHYDVNDYNKYSECAECKLWAQINLQSLHKCFIFCQDFFYYLLLLGI